MTQAPSVEMTGPDLHLLRKLHELLMKKVCERAASDSRYASGDFDPDTLRLDGALDNHNLALMQAYAAHYHRHPMKRIHGAFDALTAIEKKTGVATVMSDEHMIKNGAVRNAYDSRKRKTNGGMYMEIDVDDVTQHVFEHPEDFPYVLEAISRGHRRRKEITSVVEQMRGVHTSLIDGVL